MSLRYQNQVLSDGTSWTTCYSVYEERHASNKQRNNSTVLSNPNVFGIKNDGQPCTKCIKKGGFCHHHPNQRSDLLITNAPLRSSGFANHRTQTFTVFGITQTGEACKRCMMQKKFCYQHPSQDPSFAGSDESSTRTALRSREAPQQNDSSRRYGVTSKGEPCKRYINQNKFCYQHVSQRTRVSYAVDLDSGRVPARSHESTKSFGANTTSTARRSGIGQSTSWKEPRKPSSRRHNETTHDGRECAICMERVKSNQCYEKLRCCRNKFHSDCLGQWRLNGSTCPMCRKPLE